MILSGGEEGHKEGGAENCNVDEVFLEVLHKTGRGKCVDRGVMKAMHEFHYIWNVKPSMSKIIEGLDDGDVSQEGIVRATGDLIVGSEEHGWEYEL